MLYQRDTTYKSITVVYISALALIAAVVVASTAYLVMSTDEQKLDTAVISVSGRQRMLSQRIAMFAQTYVETGAPEHAAELETTARTMLNQHEALLKGDPRQGILVRVPEESRPYYFSEPHDLDARIRAYTDTAIALARSPAPAGAETAVLLEAILAEARGPLLESLDAAFSHFTAMANTQQNELARTDTILTALQLLMLTGLGLFLFRPMVARVRGSIDEVYDLANDLDHNEKRLASILDTLADGIITIDLTGSITSVNDAAEDIFGYSAGEMIGRNFWVLLSHTERRARKEMFEQMGRAGVTPGQLTNREITGRHKNGREFPIEVSFAVLRTPDETLFTTVVRDISERKEAEIRLTRQAWVMENIADSVIITNAAGEIEGCNSAAEDITGYSRQDLIGMPVMNLMAADDESERATVQTDARTVTDTGSVWRSEFKIRRKDGAVRIFDNTTSSMFDDRGRIIGRISVNRDVTEQREVDRMKSEFISVVSHELRTPLTSIMGSLGLIKSGAMGELNGEIASMIDIAHANSDRLVRLINDILDLEKIEAGRMEFKSEKLDAETLLKSAAQDNAGYAGKNDVDIVVTHGIQDATILGDRDKLAQVFANLISNAIKFSPRGERIELGAERHGKRVRFFVRDFGPGIPLEFHSRIFGKFSQADSSATRQKGGTGLGLSICKTIVETLGGQIGFESKIGKGSTFYFDLDEVADDIAEAPPMTQPSSALVIEDDANTATFLRIMLEDLGLRVASAATNEEARTYLDRDHFDLVTIDLSINGTEKLTILDNLEKSPINRYTPVFALSNRKREDVAALDGTAVDIAGWMTKPIDITALKDRLTKLLKDEGASKPKILHVEDDIDIIEIVRKVMHGRAHIYAATSLEDARTAMTQNSGDFDLVLLDLVLGDSRGEELLPDLTTPDGRCIPVVVFSAHDLDQNIMAKRIVTVLQKSRTSNDALAASIMSALDRRRRTLKKAG